MRYAGDEFIVVLAGCGREEAELKRAELQRAVDAVVFEAAPGKFVPLSLSAGASVFPHDGDSYEALLAKADSRMYSDKSARKRDSRPGHGGNGDPARPSSHDAGALTR
ncbi:Diguanylate cyclase DosC [compost metagenome]